MRPILLCADDKNRIFGIPSLEGIGMKAGAFFRLNRDDLIPLPYGSEIFALPRREAAAYDPASGSFIKVNANPVSAFISPGYTAAYNAAYFENKGAPLLPLFSYAPLVMLGSRYHVPAVRVDRERRHDPRMIDARALRRNILRFRREFPSNRLVRHLERCALAYGCQGAKNFFLGQYECPLPASPECNASCYGCISYQPEKECPATQPRIKFVPAPEEIAEIAVSHIKKVRKAVVSFGQGCEGEPLLVGDVLVEAVRLIRRRTQGGTINMNTNASKPGVIKRLFESGLNSVRVSVNSVRGRCYGIYYRPAGYAFNDVTASIKIAKRFGGFVSLNYLVMPGFTDTRGETKAFLSFLGRNKIDMIQWRNLNYDPIAYCRLMKVCGEKEFVGIAELMRLVKRYFPYIRFGYFNPWIPS